MTRPDEVFGPQPNGPPEDSTSDVEALLRQMPLEKPSPESDAAVLQLLRMHSAKQSELTSSHSPLVSSSRAPSWRLMWGTALASCLFGILLGRVLSLTNEVANRGPAVSTSAAVFVDQGFELEAGEQPSRVLVLEQSGSRTSRLPVRKRVVVPSTEI